MKLKSLIPAFLLTMVGCSSIPITPIITTPSKVMTLNLCQKMDEPRLDRFNRLADYLLESKTDVLLFQEGSGGIWDETMNSPKDLCDIMQKRGVPFQYRDVNSFGALAFLTFKVGVATKYPISWVYTALTCNPTGDWFDTLPLPSRKNIIALGVNNAVFISVHFYSDSDKTKQALKLLQVVNDIVLTHGLTKIVMGGDFNMGRSDPGYALIINNGFTEIAGADIDFIFARNVTGVGGIVIPTGFVSDHPAVEATIK